MSRKTKKSNEKTEQKISKSEPMDDNTYMRIQYDPKVLRLNADKFDKVVVQYQEKEYLFNMKKILKFLCEEVK